MRPLPFLLPLLLACHKAPPPEVAAVATTPVAPAADAAPAALEPPPARLADHYDPVPPAVADCTLYVDNQVAWLAQLACPGDRVLTDMRGPGVPPPEGAMQAVMETLSGLGLASAPRQAPVPLPGGVGQAMVVDAEGSGLSLTTWVVHHMGNMPQVLTCMALRGDTTAEAWCLEAMAAMLLPPGPPVPTLPVPAAG